jgi:hypothetical protein
MSPSTHNNSRNTSNISLKPHLNDPHSDSNAPTSQCITFDSALAALNLRILQFSSVVDKRKFISAIITACIERIVTPKDDVNLLPCNFAYHTRGGLRLVTGASSQRVRGIGSWQQHVRNFLSFDYFYLNFIHSVSTLILVDFAMLDT